MNKQFTEIKFENNSELNFQFECVSYEDVLKKKPTDHSQFDFHKVSFYGILLCLKNTGVHNINFKDFDLKNGTLLTLRKDNIHKFYRNKIKGILLIFTEDFVLSSTNEHQASKTFLLFNEMLASPKLQLNAKEFKEITNLIKLIQEEFLEAKDDYSLDIVRSYTQVIITKLFRIKSKQNIVFENQKRLSQFLELQAHVERECFKHKTVSYYSKSMGVTSKTLNNITQNIIKKSAKSFINEIVISQIKRLIINSPESLTEIAFQSGFEEATNFFKYFKKYSGVSPRQFREEHLST